ncbi:MAG TPA: PRC-barrel domain containing protein [Thermoanaerobaculia bacterium]|nr:PRC-barrel domain containing protein [Thermoanaerobaculia bacterium]
MSRKVNLELLLGKMVRDPDEVRVGRIFSVQAELDGDECIVREYHLGGAALLERLGISFLQGIGGAIPREPLRVPWDQLDLSDPERPLLRCRVAELGSRARG